MPYSSAQNRAITDFKSVTSADSKTATKWLKANGWETTTAVNAFFNQSSSSAPASNTAKVTLNKLFDKYRDVKTGLPDLLGIEEIMPYFTAINANPAELSALVVQEIMQCPEMGALTREGFVEGWTALGCDTLDKQKRFLDQRTKTLGQSGDTLRAVYKYAFELCITGQGQRLVSKDELIELWRLLFSPPGLDWRTARYNWREEWLEFVTGNSAKAYNRDVWTQTLRFAQETMRDETLGWWNEESSWPSLIDDFVEWFREKHGLRKAAQFEDEEMEY